MNPLLERPGRDLVGDSVVDTGAAALLGEPVLVNPSSVWPPELLVDKSMGRLPRGDGGSLPHGDEPQANTIVDQRPLAHLDGQRGQDAEAEIRRRKLLQVLCS
jgi:hypothetical protein